ncbi:MAG: hypothetical protein AAF572_03120 [Cyanobacteria bacterium P01_B01_bin.77]
MVKKLILICLIGLIQIFGLASPAWGQSWFDGSLWLAETVPQTTVPTKQPKPESSKNTNTLHPSTTSPSNNQQQKPPKTQVEQLSKGQSPTQPFSPYDMEALRQFDAGDHRSK